MAVSESLSKVEAEAAINLTDEQVKIIRPTITRWQTKGGLVIGSLAEDKSGKFQIGFRQLPAGLANKITDLIREFYQEKS